MKNPKISVIIPVYNMESYLDKCIQSVMGQTYVNIEIILVNDGSTDNSLDICRKYHQCDDRIIIVDQKNKGLVAARKSGIINSTGDYVAFVDADDWIEADTYEKLMNESDNEDVIVFGLVEDYDTCSVKKTSNYREGVYDTEAISSTIIPDIFDTEMFFQFNMIPNLVCKIVKRKLMNSVIPYVSNDVTMGEDVDFTCQLITRAISVNIVASTPYHYVQRQSSMVRSCTAESSLYSLYKDLRDVNVPQGLEERWNMQICAYMSFILQLKGMELYVEKSSFFNRFRNSSVIIYGAGNYGRSVSTSMKNRLGVHIEAVADRDWSNRIKSFADIAPVIAPKDIAEKRFEYIYIAILNERVCESVKGMLMAQGISPDRIIYYSMSDIDAGEIMDIIEELK